ncbi:MAG: amidohydrolase [Chloroflexota bacterium]|nr:amidohydrolase [Chloroflexota bacterium]
MATTTMVRDEIAEWEPELIATRRDFHMHPEMGLEEVRTSGIVVERLRAIGFDEIETGIAVTGVKAVLRGGKPGKTILLRADMDALPIEEENAVEYRSQTAGTMHACGHDAHTAILLSAARILMRHRDELAGTVVFCFQPAEEGRGGARKMVAAGVLENPHVDAAIGLHVMQDVPLGTITVFPGPMMAGGDVFDVKIQGKGGHAAMPNETVDALVVAVACVNALQTLVSREVAPIAPAVLTVATLHAGGTAANIIADTATFNGTTRYFDLEVGDQLAARLPALVKTIAEGMRATAEVEMRRVVPPTVNEPGMASLVESVAQEVVGAEKVFNGPRTMGGEDFSEFTYHAPSCFFWVGSRDEASGKVWGHHHPRFDIDERCLAIGVEMMVRTTMRYLEQGGV